MPEEYQDKYDGGEEMGCFEKFITQIPVECVSCVVLVEVAFSAITYRITLWDAKVSQAWKMMATMPVQ